MGEIGDDHIKWNKPDSRRQISQITSYIWRFNSYTYAQHTRTQTHPPTYGIRGLFVELKEWGRIRKGNRSEYRQRTWISLPLFLLFHMYVVCAMFMVCTCMCACMHVLLHVWVHDVYMHMCAYVHTNAYMCVNACVYEHLFGFLCMCIYAYISVNMHVEDTG